MQRCQCIRRYGYQKNLTIKSGERESKDRLPDFTPLPPLNYMPLSIALNSPFSHCDRWMDERGRRGWKPALGGSGFPSFAVFFPAISSHPVPSLTLSCPLFALSHHYVPVVTGPALQIGFAQEWQGKERDDVTGPCPSVVTPGSNNTILSENRG